MQIEPPESAFAERYGRGQPQVVWCTLVADLETPVSAFLKLGTGKPMSFLLESVEGGAVRGRHSIIGIEPDLRVDAGLTRGDREPAIVQLPGAEAVLPIGRLDAVMLR